MQRGSGEHENDLFNPDLDSDAPFRPIALEELTNSLNDSEFWNGILDPESTKDETSNPSWNFRGGLAHSESNSPVIGIAYTNPMTTQQQLQQQQNIHSNPSFQYALQQHFQQQQQQVMHEQQQQHAALQEQQQQLLVTAMAAQQQLFNQFPKPNTSNNNNPNTSNNSAFRFSAQQAIVIKELSTLLQRLSTIPANGTDSRGIFFAVNEEKLPKHVFGGQSSQGQRTQISVGVEINVDVLKQVVEYILYLARDKSAFLNQEAFQQFCAKARIRIKLDELLVKVADSSRSSKNYSFSSMPWKGDIVLIKTNKNQVTERPAGLQRGTTSNGSTTTTTTTTTSTSIDNSTMGTIEEGSAPGMKRVEYNNLTLEETSSNRPICKFRYKICFDTWFEIYQDGDKVFQVKCTKTSVLQKQKQQKLKGTAPTPPTPASVPIPAPKPKPAKLVRETDDNVPPVPRPATAIPPPLSIPMMPQQQQQQQQLSPVSKETPSFEPIIIPPTMSLSIPPPPIHVQKPPTTQEKQSPNTLANFDELIHQIKSSQQKDRDFYINPMKGTTRGGDFVFIEIKNPKIQINRKISDPNQATEFLSCHIFFGDEQATILQTNNNSFFVKTPPNYPGKVNVVISSGDVTFSDPMELSFEYTGNAQDAVEENSRKRKFASDERSPYESPMKRARSSDTLESQVVEVVPPPIQSQSTAQASPMPTEATAYTNCWALVIGINEYQSSQFGVLNSAVKDAMRVSSILQQDYGYQVFTLFNNEATKNRIYQLFEEMAEKVRKDDCVLVYFAGHGLFKQYKSDYVSGYMCPYDTNPDNLSSTAISYKIFREIHEWFTAKHILFVLDACYAGNLFKMRAGFGDSNTEIEYFGKNKAVQLICASSDVHQAAEDQFGGLFSSHFVDALKTGVFHKQKKRRNYFTAEQLAVWVQEKVIAATEGKQIPQYGKIEVGDGQFMFFPKVKPGYNPDLERVIALITIHQEYLHSLNLGDLDKHPQLLHLLKFKFNQATKFYLDNIQSLLKDNTLELDSSVFLKLRLNLSEALDSTRFCYLSVCDELPDWVAYRKYHLQDMSQQLVKRYNVVVKRIFILNKDQKYTANDEVIKIMKFHAEKLVDVRIVYSHQLEDRLDIPHNFSILDFRLSHVLMNEDGYAKSVMVFNTSCIQRYYSFWLHLFSNSVSLNDYLVAAGLPSIETPNIPDTQPLPAAANIFAKRNTEPNSANNKVLHQHLNPMLQKYKEKIQSFLSLKANKKHLTEQSKALVLEKFQKLNMFYENILTNFFSEGRLVTHSKFFDMYRFRMYEIERIAQHNYYGLINEDMLNMYETGQSTALYTCETAMEIADVNQRLIQQRHVKIKRIFLLKKGSDHAKVLELMKYHHERGCKVFVLVVDLDKEELAKVPGSYLIIDEGIVGSNSFATQKEMIYMKNKLCADKTEVDALLASWKALRAKAVEYEKFVTTAVNTTQ